MNFYVERAADGTPKPNSNVYFTKTGYVGSLLDITDSVNQPYIGSGKERDQPRYYIKLTSSGIPQAGTLTTVRPIEGRFIDITKAYLENSVVNTFFTNTNVLYAIIVVGHSNATNMSNQTPPAGFANVNFGTNKKVEWNGGDSAMQVVNNTLTTPNDRLAQHILQPTFYGQYNPAVILTNEMARRVKEYTNKDIQFISLSGSANGGIISNNGTAFGNPQLANNSVSFNYLKQGLEAAKTYAISVGKTLEVAFAMSIVGEVENLFWDASGSTEYKYKTNHVKYHRELRAMIKLVTGSSFEPKIYRHQMQLNGGTDMDNMRGKQYAIDMEDPKSPVVFAGTAIDNASDFEHYGTTGTFKWIGVAAEQIFKDTYLNGTVVFKPYQFTVSGAIIRIKCRVPYPPLKIDTSRGGTPIEDTFIVLRQDSSEISVDSVTINGPDELVLQCSENVAGCTIYHKLKRPYLTGTVQQQRDRAQADIIDSNPATFFGLKTPAYLLSFQKQL